MAPIQKPDSVAKDGEQISFDVIHLDHDPLDAKLSDCLISRKSAKSIKQDQHLNKIDLGTFLKGSVGCLESEKDRRTYPSAGPLYPNHIFVAVKQVAHLQSGLYQYLPDEHALILVNESIEIENALVQPNIDFNFCVIVAADLIDATHHYGERGYRFCLLEAGHMVQNMMLVASALGKAIAPIGGFKDEYVNEHVLPSEKEFSALYLIPVGEQG